MLVLVALTAGLHGASTRLRLSQSCGVRFNPQVPYNRLCLFVAKLIHAIVVTSSQMGL